MENGHFLGQERWSKLCFCLWFWYGDKRMQEEAFNLCEVCSQHVSYGLLWLPSPSLLCFWAKKTPKPALLLFGMVWDLPCCCHCVLGCGLCHGEQSCGLCPSG